MKGGLFNKQISLPLLSIVLSILVVLFAGWLLFTLGKREGFQEGATVNKTIASQAIKSGGGISQAPPPTANPNPPPTANPPPAVSSSRQPGQALAQSRGSGIRTA